MVEIAKGEFYLTETLFSKSLSFVDAALAVFKRVQADFFAIPPPVSAVQVLDAEKDVQRKMCPLPRYASQRLRSIVFEALERRNETKMSNYAFYMEG